MDHRFHYFSKAMTKRKVLTTRVHNLQAGMIHSSEIPSENSNQTFPEKMLLTKALVNGEHLLTPMDGCGKNPLESLKRLAVNFLTRVYCQ